MVWISEAIACLLLADFLTGLAHWAEDTYAVRTWPILRETIVEPNIQHHKDPSSFAKTSFWYRNRENLSVVLGFMGVLWIGGWLSWKVALVLSLISIANEVHAWSHRRPQVRGIRILQDSGILQSPRHHNEHHRYPFSRRYCILTNMVNPFLDELKFWRVLEWGIAKLGISVKRCSPERDGV